MKILALQPTEREIKLYEALYPGCEITVAPTTLEYYGLQREHDFDLCIFLSDWYTEVEVRWKE